MYGLVKSLRDISNHIKDMYDTDISQASLSAITDKIIPRSKGVAIQATGRPLYHCLA